jgi:hypothetical protein
MAEPYETLFEPVSVATPISATTASARTALSTDTAVQNEYPRIVSIASRTGDSDVWVTFGNSAVAATTTTGIIVHGGTARGFRVPASATHVAAITATGTATVNVVNGRGF